MKFHSIGNPANPAVLLLHGAGLSWWAYHDAAALLAARFHVELAVIDGYGEANDIPFTSIQASAERLAEHIRQAHGGQVFALGGLSLGAQITVEALATHPDIAQFAIIESALVCPMPGAKALFAPMASMSYGLLRRKWFARLQAKALCVPGALFEDYYRDSLRLSRASLVNTLISNAAYALPPAFARTQAQALVLAGEKEPAVMRKSARLLQAALPASTLVIARGMKHGELSLQHPETYAALVLAFLTAQPLPTL
jgi:pimeloyl-ACP methyl ester carboxylesterase